MPIPGPASLGLLLAALLMTPVAGAAQEDCKMLFCSPKLTFMPSLTLVPAFGQATVATLRNGVPVDTIQVERREEFAAVLSFAIPSTIPRTSFFVTLYWLPFADAQENVYTGYTADELDDDDVDANSPVVEIGASLTLLKQEQTNGWLSIAGNVVDQFSPAREPDDASTYTHKLSLELQGTLAIFNRLPQDTWLRNVKAYATLDYTATGLPDAGDVMPKGERLWLDDASPWQLWAGLVIPIAPLTT